MDWATSEQGKDYFTQLLHKKDACTFIAQKDGKPVGYITAAPPADLSSRKSRYIEIENLGVNLQYRSHGIGAMLMKNV